ncbi:translation initiation factor IF-5A [Candidatus Micrarchaeota archaeon CG1_02_55_22]|nr:MAG: translation initiation factor IF-5A [Candidatus Micrarchaeota archaeon CG1_02_55_22]
MSGEKIFGKMGDLKVGKYVIVDEHPCRIVSMDKSKPGKHGAAKINVVAISLLDHSKKSLMKSSDSDCEIPIAVRRRAQIVSVAGKSAQLMDLESFETFEVTIPEDLSEEMDAGKEIQYMDVMGHRLLTQVFN